MKRNEKTSKQVDQKALVEDKVRKARANGFNEPIRTNNTNGVPRQ